MRKLLLTFMLFLAALQGLANLNIAVLLAAFGAFLALVVCLHILATPGQT